MEIDFSPGRFFRPKILSRVQPVMNRNLCENVSGRIFISMAGSNEIKTLKAGPEAERALGEGQMLCTPSPAHCHRLFRLFFSKGTITLRPSTI